jgi:phosphohistidine phosphatase SixA
MIYSLIFALTTQISSANELAIWDKLQGTAPKGYVLLLRHSLAPGVGDPANFTLNDCSTQRNLSAVGRQDARDVGQWLQRREIKIARVESSRWCRAKETLPCLTWEKFGSIKALTHYFKKTMPSTIHKQSRSESKSLLTAAKQDYWF